MPDSYANTFTIVYLCVVLRYSLVFTWDSPLGMPDGRNIKLCHPKNN